MQTLSFTKQCYAFIYLHLDYVIVETKKKKNSGLLTAVLQFQFAIAKEGQFRINSTLWSLDLELYTHTNTLSFQLPNAIIQ